MARPNPDVLIPICQASADTDDLMMAPMEGVAGEWCSQTERQSDARSESYFGKGGAQGFDPGEVSAKVFLELKRNVEELLRERRPDPDRGHNPDLRANGTVRSRLRLSR